MTGRLDGATAIDRTQPLAFRFNGRPLTGFAGDTLAAALLANGVAPVARSFKYHRPRGIYAAGPEEPCALVQLGSGGATVPNARAPMVELADGLTAASQNAWPSVRFDVGVPRQRRVGPAAGGLLQQDVHVAGRPLDGL